MNTSLRRIYSEALDEPIPDDFLNLLGELPSFSDGGSGAGVREVGPTSLGSELRHADRASLSIGTVQATSHNRCGTLNAHGGGRVP